MSNGSRKTRGILARAVLTTALVGGLAAGFGLPAAASASASVDAVVPCLLQAPGAAPTVCDGANKYLDAQRDIVANGFAAGRAPLRVVDEAMQPQTANALRFAESIFGVVNEFAAAEGIMDPKYSKFARNANESTHAQSQLISVAEGDWADRLANAPTYGVAVGETRKNVTGGYPQSASVPAPPENYGQENPYDLTPLPRPASVREIGEERPPAAEQPPYAPPYAQPPASRPSAPTRPAKPASKPPLSPLGMLLPILGLGGLG